MEDNPQWHGKAPSHQAVPIILRELESQAAVAPSIIAGDMARLDREVSRCHDAGADYIHLDVMDGVFVPNTTFDHAKIRELRPLTDIPFDTHLMISEPVRSVRRYAEAGSDIITVHAEACDASEFGEIIDYLRSNDVGAGIAVNPATPVPEWLDAFVPRLDQFIVMSVVPGRSGQAYIESSHQKTQDVATYLRDRGFGGVIEADGGVNTSNVSECFADGARTFVGGSSMVGQTNMGQAIHHMRVLILGARRLGLLREAHRLGGPDLVEKWAALHTVGGKAGLIREMAAEASLS
jgi:transketolase